MGIGRLLFLIYFFSFLLTIIFLSVYVLLIRGDADDIRVFYMIIAGSFFINLQLIFTASVGILISAYFGKNKRKAFIACFITAAIILLVIFSGLLKLQSGDIEAYSITVLSFTLVLGYFFFKNLTPNNTQPLKEEVN